MELNNHTFDEINIGDNATLHKTLTDKDVVLFAAASGDVNPLHLDEQYANSTQFKHRIGHGMWLGALISSALGNEFPGPGTVYLSQNISFKRPVFLNDRVSITLTATAKHPDKPVLTLSCEAVNQDKKLVAVGEAVVLAPTEKISINAPDLPQVNVA